MELAIHSSEESLLAYPWHVARQWETDWMRWLPCKFLPFLANVFGKFSQSSICITELELKSSDISSLRLPECFSLMPGCCCLLLSFSLQMLHLYKFSSNSHNPWTPPARDRELITENLSLHYMGETFLGNLLGDQKVHSATWLKSMAVFKESTGLCKTYLNIYVFSIFKCLYLHIHAAVHICCC